MRCPKCGREFPGLLALSREDNKTKICDGCGMHEALDAAAKAASSMDNAALEYHLQRRKQMADLDRNSLEIMRKGLDVPV